jgi:hypothetical protein
MRTDRTSPKTYRFRWYLGSLIMALALSLVSPPGPLRAKARPVERQGTVYVTRATAAGAILCGF